MGTLAANSEYANAVNIAAIAPIKNDISMPGPVKKSNSLLPKLQCSVHEVNYITFAV